MLQSATDVFPVMERYIPFAERRIQIQAFLIVSDASSNMEDHLKARMTSNILWEEEIGLSSKWAGYDTGTTTTTIKQSEHDRLVEETKKKMLPDECPKLNRAQSTGDNNRNEVVKLIM